MNRRLHGYGVCVASLVLRRPGALTDRRFYHVFASAWLRPTPCAYLHNLRKGGLNGHLPIEAEFEWPRCAT